jgi:hypothetical protein
MDLDAEALDARRQERRRSDDPHPGAHGAEQDDVGACHSRMEDIPAYGDHEALDPPLAAADGERV